MTNSGLMVLFPTQTNSYVRPFNFCRSTVSNFTVHFQVRKHTVVFPFYFFLNICVKFLYNNESSFDTFQYFSHMPFCISAPNNEIITDPTGIHFYSDLCEELLDWSFTLSTTRGFCYDLVTVYLFCTVSLPSMCSFNVISHENMVSGMLYLFL